MFRRLDKLTPGTRYSPQNNPSIKQYLVDSGLFPPMDRIEVMGWGSFVEGVSILFAQHQIDKVSGLDANEEQLTSHKMKVSSKIPLLL